MQYNFLSFCHLHDYYEPLSVFCGNSLNEIVLLTGNVNCGTSLPLLMNVPKLSDSRCKYIQLYTKREPNS